jgi:hypothetical protein
VKFLSNRELVERSTTNGAHPPYSIARRAASCAAQHVLDVGAPRHAEVRDHQIFFEDRGHRAFVAGADISVMTIRFAIGSQLF